MTFVAAVCPQCSGNLQVPDDRDVIKCMYCGVDVVVRQAIRLVHGNTDNLLELADSARSAGNHSEAIGYYNKVLENDPKNVRAWAGKATSAGWSSTLLDFRFQEMFVGFDNAIKYSDDTSRPAISAEAATTINEVASACYQISRKHVAEFIALDNTWAEYLPRCEMIMSALQVAHSHDPSNQTIIENLIHLCKDNIEGFSYNDPYDNNIRKAVHLSDSYEDQLRSLMAESAEKLKALNPSYQPPEAKRPSAGCFVVTATFGDPNHPQVRILRAFRDDVLQHSRAGAALCRLYYAHGPSVARAIAHSALLKAISRVLIVLPASALARSVLSKRISRSAE